MVPIKIVLLAHLLVVLHAALQILVFPVNLDFIRWAQIVYNVIHFAINVLLLLVIVILVLEDITWTLQMTELAFPAQINLAAYFVMIILIANNAMLASI